MLVRRDTVITRESVEEAFISGDSTSFNSLRAEVLGCRKLVGGCWAVRSCQGCSELPRLCEEAESLARTLNPARCPVPEDFEVEFYSGRVNLGAPVDLENLVRPLVELCGEYSTSGYEVTAILRVRKLLREIRGEASGEATEGREVIEISVGVKYGAERPSYGSSDYVVLAGVGKEVEKVVENLLRLARDRARRLGIAEVGRAEVILIREAAPALFHEVSHLLQGDLGTPLLGRGIFDHEKIYVYDSPGDVAKPSVRFFDDEGVVTRRRWLVEGGAVVDLHHTIRTAYVAKSSPGSAHGLFHRPRPLHTSLVVGGGDWREEELVEETKKGLLIDGIAAAFLEEGVIRIVPQVAYRIEGGEVREPVVVRAVKIPLARPIRVLGLGRGEYLRFSYEDFAFTTEAAPPLKIEAYIEI
jgi:predicted Zn-dependent protease